MYRSKPILSMRKVMPIQPSGGSKKPINVVLSISTMMLNLIDET